MKQVKFKVTYINYDVDSQSAEEALIEESGDREYSDEEIDNKKKEIEDSLPKSLIIVLDKKEIDRYEPEDVDEPICDKISEITGWCVNSFNFEQIKENKKTNQRG